MTSGIISSGGGFSPYDATPSWQSNQVERYFATVTGTSKEPVSGYVFAGVRGRGFPDISLVGKHFATIIGGIDSKQAVTTTSNSAAAIAAMFALINSNLTTSKKSRLGFVNPLLYKRADEFITDITEGHNKCTIGGTCCAQGFYAAEGWDPMTGLGVPNFQKLLNTAYSPKRVANSTITEAQKSSDDGLSAGALAGIIIGSVLGVFILSVLLARYCFDSKFEFTNNIIPVVDTPSRPVVELGAHSQSMPQHTPSTGTSTRTTTSKPSVTTEIDVAEQDFQVLVADMPTVDNAIVIAEVIPHYGNEEIAPPSHEQKRVHQGDVIHRPETVQSKAPGRYDDSHYLFKLSQEEIDMKLLEFEESLQRDEEAMKSPAHNPNYITDITEDALKPSFPSTHFMIDDAIMHAEVIQNDALYNAESVEKSLQDGENSDNEVEQKVPPNNPDYQVEPIESIQTVLTDSREVTEAAAAVVALDHTSNSSKLEDSSFQHSLVSPSQSHPQKTFAQASLPPSQHNPITAPVQRYPPINSFGPSISPSIKPYQLNANHVGRNEDKPHIDAKVPNDQ